MSGLAATRHESGSPIGHLLAPLVEERAVDVAAHTDRAVAHCLRHGSDVRAGAHQRAGRKCRMPCSLVSLSPALRASRANALLRYSGWYGCPSSAVNTYPASRYAGP